MCSDSGAVLVWDVGRAQRAPSVAGTGWALLYTPWVCLLEWNMGRVLCARCRQLGNLEGSCRKGCFTAAASEQCLWLLLHRCPQAGAEQVSAAGVGETLPGSERSCCCTAVTAACARVC